MLSLLRELRNPPKGESRLDIVLVLAAMVAVAGALSLTGLPGGCM